MQSKIYRRVTKSLAQNMNKKVDSVDELAFFALVYWLRQCDQSIDKLTSLLESDSWDKPVRAFLNQIVQSHMDLIFETAATISDEELQRIIQSLSVSRGVSTAKTDIPTSLAALAMQLLHIQPGDTIADLCSGLGSFSLAACRQYPKISCIAIEKDKKLHIGAAIQAALTREPVTAVFGDIFDAVVLRAHSPVNKVFCHIPKRCRYGDLETWVQSYPELSPLFFNEKRNVTGEWVFAAVAKTLYAPQGRVVLLMEGTSISKNLDRHMRQKFLQQGWIETIIALPERLMPGHTASYMVVLSNGNEKVHMVDATAFFEQICRKSVLTSENVQQIMECVDKDTNKSCTLSRMQLAGNQYILDPKQYLTEFDERLKGAETLNNLCTIIRGYVTKSEIFQDFISDEATAYQYFRVQDMENGTIRQDLPYLKALPRGGEKSCIQSGDVLLSKLMPFKAAIAENVDSQKILATENIYILRCRHAAIEPVYLLLYLQSKLGIQEFSYWSKGGQVQSLSIQNLKKVRIPIMAEERQKEIAEQYQKLQKKRIEAENKLKKIQKEIQDLVE